MAKKEIGEKIKQTLHSMQEKEFGEKILHALHPTKKKVIIAAIIVVLAGGGFGIKAYLNKKHAAETAAAVETDTVTRGDVEVTITGSASVEPYERYEIISMVSGDIVSSPYEVGDTVEKGAILYQFDTSDTDLSMQKQELSMQQSQIEYNNALENKDKLTIRAKASGVMSGMNYKVGDEVEANTVLATLTDSKMLEVTLPFTAAQIGNIWVGQSATISSSIHMSSVTGTVTHKDANPQAQADGSSLYNVTIAFENPGAFTAGLVVGGEIGGMISPGSGAVEYTDEGKVTAEIKGTIKSLNYSNGDYVKKGAIVATLSSSDLADDLQKSSISYENAQLSMQQARESLEDYSIESPISGTVITKNSKVGDTIDRTNSTQTLMVVADISKLKFSLEIDELDVSKVSVGQEVSITSDALEGEEYTGVITNVSVEGTATNGVTTYSAEVVIYEPGNLRPSMNVDASVIIESAEDTLLVPTEDIKTIMGKSYVYLKSDGEDEQEDKKRGEKSKDEEMSRGEKPERPANGEMPEGGMPEGEMPEMPEGMEPPAGGEMPDGAAGGRAASAIQAPDGFKAVEVEIGVSSDDYTEILSGLSEGDQIQRLSITSESSQMNMMGGMPGGMGGGMAGGGMAGGGMGGGPGGGGGMGGGPR